MRKIEVEMLDAVRACQGWQSGNTCVAPIPASESGTPAETPGPHAGQTRVALGPRWKARLK